MQDGRLEQWICRYVPGLYPKQKQQRSGERALKLGKEDKALGRLRYTPSPGVSPNHGFNKQRPGLHHRTEASPDLKVSGGTSLILMMVLSPPGKEERRDYRKL